MSKQVFLGELQKKLKALGYQYTRNTLKKWSDEGKIFKFHKTPGRGDYYIMDGEFEDFVKSLEGQDGN